MKKAISAALGIMILVSCGSRETRVRKTVDERGVEVVLNGLEPIPLKGEPRSLSLEEEMTLDTEKDAVAGTGLADIGIFSVDSDGNIYFAALKAGDNTILKFDRQGRHIASFGKKGQGPGEIQRINALFITDRNEVAVTNDGNNRLTIYNADGELLREVPLASGFIAAIPLANGHYFLWDRVPSDRPGVLLEFPMTLAGPDLKTIKTLDTGIIENPMDGEQLRGTYHLQSWSVSKDMIFTGHQDRGYDIFVYDLAGQPIRKIRKEHAPVPIPDAHKKEFLRQFESPQFKDIIGKIYFPDAMPPFIGFTSDEKGRLYVMTYETGEQPGEFIFDIFNSDGVFILRKPIRVFQNFLGLFVKVRNDRLYCVQEKESGYKEFKVYRMIWESI
jgi:hypothetical protein